MGLSNRKDTFFRHETAEITFFIIFGVIMAIILPIVLGFGLLAFEESFVPGQALQFGTPLTTYIIYFIMILGAFSLAVMKWREMAITDKDEHPSKQSDPKHLAVAYLHDPEQDGALYNLFDGVGFKGKENPMRWSISLLRMFVIFAFIFSAVGWLQTGTGFQFVGTPQLAQVTPVSEVLLTSEPASFAETNLMILVLSIIMSELAWGISKIGGGKVGYFLIGSLIVPLIIAFLWAGFHRIVYGNNEAALATTFLFGLIGSFLTVAFGSFIPWYTWHFFNNAFVALASVSLFREDLLLVFAILWIIALAFYIGIEIFLATRRKNRKKYIPPVPD